MNLWERYVVPPLISMACSARPIMRQRMKIVPQAEGVVLELGFGSGLNLPHYDPAKVTRLFALEPAPGMVKRARKAAEGAQVPVEIVPARAEDLPLGPASVDTVLVTYSLCTIPDPVTALDGARRALKPGGRLLYCEHGLAPDPEVQRTQRRIEPFWKPIAGGCHLCRDIAGLVAHGGFQPETTETMYLPNTPPWAGFNTWGSALPR
jgi:ubiquinone/menaquinone biosynthesis C-methylase UbiE